MPQILTMMQEITAQVTDGLNNIGHSLEKIFDATNNRMQSWEPRIESLQKALENEGAAGEISIDLVEDEGGDVLSSPAETADLTEEDQNKDHKDFRKGEKYGSPSSSCQMNEEPVITEEGVDTTLQESNKIEIEKYLNLPVEPDRPTMSTHHSTMAMLLLDWPSISDLVIPVMNEKTPHQQESPMQEEQQRGLLPIRGNGKGFGLEIPPSTKKSYIDSNKTGMASSFFYTSLPLADEQLRQSSMLGNVTHKGGTSNIDGTPDFDSPTVEKYVQSFKENILSIHPIMDIEELEMVVAMFLQSLPPKESQNSMTKPSSTLGTGSCTIRASAGTKRKRSSALGDLRAVPPLKPNLPFRNIESAMILSVLALGKICLLRGSITKVVPDQPLPTEKSSSVHSRMLAPPLEAPQPGMTSQSLPLLSLPFPRKNEQSRSDDLHPPQAAGPHTKVQSMGRHRDQAPGLEYFALATDIIGSHVGGTTIQHVYTWLFMGLYYGQLERPMDSWAHIANGCKALAVCLQSKVPSCHAGSSCVC